jgi:hypothetical protein
MLGLLAGLMRADLTKGLTAKVGRQRGQYPDDGRLTPLLEQLIDLVVGVGQRSDRRLARQDIVHSGMHDAFDLRGMISDREQERGLLLHIDRERRYVDALDLECGLGLVSRLKGGGEA